MDIISAYREMGTYRGAAQITGTTPKTVKRVIDRHEAGGGAPAQASREHDYDGVAEFGGRAGGQDSGPGEPRPRSTRRPGSAAPPLRPSEQSARQAITSLLREGNFEALNGADTVAVIAGHPELADPHTVGTGSGADFVTVRAEHGGWGIDYPADLAGPEVLPRCFAAIRSRGGAG